MSVRAFVPGRDGRFYLLRAHRQPMAENVAAAFIRELSAPNDLIIDPFIGSDAVVRAALAQGRRILAADSNPLVAWAARVQATLPNARDIHGALLRLGDAKKEGETLRAAVEKLYAAQCAQCGGAVVVDRFVWRKTLAGAGVPAEKIYTCANCGTRRDDTTEADRQRAQDAAPRGLSYHLLVQYLLADDAANTPLLKRLLQFYTPRNLNALAAVTQKLDTDFREDAARNVLAALMLHALDVGTSLYPTNDELPMRQIPDEFVEVNVWRALEEAARGLSENRPGLRLASSAAQVVKSATPAAFIGQGGARYLLEQAADARAALVLSSPARLDPAFWELSFLWTRWLFGKHAAMPLEPLLDEKRQRWSWYGDALTHSIEDTAKLVREDASFVVAFPSGSHAMIEALMLAGAPVFALQSFAFRPARGAVRSTEWGALRGDYQAVWKRADAGVTAAQANVVATKIRAGALQAAREIMEARGEPMAYSWLHHAGLQKLAMGNVLAEAMSLKYREGDNAFQSLRHRMEEGFKEGFLEEIDHWEEKGRVLWMKREGGGRGAGSGERGARGMGRGREEERREERGETETDLAARVEESTREIFQTRSSNSTEKLERELLGRFGGLLTPEIELVEMCARAYADLVEGEWVAREENGGTFAERAMLLAKELGKHLDFQVVQDSERFDLIWRIEKIIPGSSHGSVRQESIHEDAYAFRICERADFDDLISQSAVPLRGLVIVPESQVELTRERLRRDPRWVKKLERAGWEFLRLPMMELILREDAATRPEFRLAWGLEPGLEGGQERLELF